jgi:4'-phosphopantetheinyl transferase
MKSRLLTTTVNHVEIVFGEFADQREHLPELRRHLSDDEVERAGRFLVPGLGDDWTICHAWLRVLLAEKSGCRPDEILFATNEHGKPSLSGRRGPWFNLSHSKTSFLIGFSTAGPIGVDVESLRQVEDAEDIAERYFAESEAAMIARLEEPERSEVFLRIWTLKESYLKALGTGLTTPLNVISISEETLRCDSLVFDRWPLHRVPVTGNSVAALCCPRNGE